VRFVQGSHLVSWSALALLICLGVIGALLVLAFVGELIEPASLAQWTWMFLPAMTTGFAAAMVWGIWRGNRQRDVDPKALPADFAPHS